MHPDARSLAQRLDEFACHAAESESHAPRATAPRVSTDGQGPDWPDRCGARLWDDLHGKLTRTTGGFSVGGYRAVEEEQRFVWAEAGSALKRKDDLEEAISQIERESGGERATTSPGVEKAVYEAGRDGAEAKFLYFYHRAEAIAEFLRLAKEGVVGDWEGVRGSGTDDERPGSRPTTVDQLGYFAALLEVAEKHGLGDDIEAWGEHFDLDKRGMDLFGEVAKLYGSKVDPVDPTTPRSSFVRAEAWGSYTTLREGLKALLDRARKEVEGEEKEVGSEE